jgi:hypothetical protein
MSKIPELMSGRKLEHSADIIGTITTQRDVVAAPAAKVGGQILSVQNVTLTAIADTVLGSVSLPASPDGSLPGSLRAGTVIRVRAVGLNSNNAGANNLTLNVKLGATLGAAVTYATLTTNPGALEYIYIQADIHILSVGASGGVIATGRSKVGSVGEATAIAAGTVNTTVANTLFFTGSWAVAESFTLGNLSVEIVGG